MQAYDHFAMTQPWHLPADHSQRTILNDEVHARPPEEMAAPCRVSYIALTQEGVDRDAGLAAVTALAALFRAEPPEPGSNHYSADLGAFRVKWERHSEFLRYTFIVDGADDNPFVTPAIAAVPAAWLAALPGQVMVAAHVALLPPTHRMADPDQDPVELATRIFPRSMLVGSAVGGGAIAFTDFRITADGFTRFLIQDRSMTQWQAGRVVQRLLEIDTYRVMALLALPVAQSLAPVIARVEREVAGITAAMVTASDADEPVLLDRLTRLAAEIDSRQADNLYRFSAAAAYDSLVQRRISELREVRIAGLQTWQEFTDRRLAPAMSTCVSVAGRQEELSRRVARATQLLSTRVGVTREQQNQELLDSMNRRVRMQLRLQATVEGLSIAAVTYYIVGLVGYLAKGAHAAGAPLNSDVAMGVAIPIVAGVMYWALRKARANIHVDD